MTVIRLYGCTGDIAIQVFFGARMSPDRLTGGYSGKRCPPVDRGISSAVYTANHRVSLFFYNRKAGPFRILEAVLLFRPHYGKWRHMPPRDLERTLGHGQASLKLYGPRLCPPFGRSRSVCGACARAPSLARLPRAPVAMCSLPAYFTYSLLCTTRTVITLSHFTLRCLENPLQFSLVCLVQGFRVMML